MKLGGSELAALPRLDQLCSDYRDLVGEHCATMLASGSKIELESVLWRCAGRSEP
jgi:hypothetical protein